MSVGMTPVGESLSDGMSKFAWGASLTVACVWEEGPWWSASLVVNVVEVVAAEGAEATGVGSSKEATGSSNGEWETMLVAFVDGELPGVELGCHEEDPVDAKG